MQVNIQSPISALIIAIGFAAAATSAAPRPPQGVAPGVEKPLLIAPRPDNGRNSEGDFIQLKDGRLLLVYSKFLGTGDHAPAELVGRYSSDGGKTWDRDDVQILARKRGEANLMSVSLLRLQDDRIALFYVQKYESPPDAKYPYLDYLFMRTSRDEGLTWSDPTYVVPQEEPGYRVLNNDRVIQLKTGRLVVPVAVHYLPGWEKWRSSARILCYLSDDQGKTWRPSKASLESELLAQEPGVVELKDDGLLMFCRSRDCQLVSRSEDGGDTWSPLKRSNIAQPTASPASIERIPATGHLLLVWNNGDDALAAIQPVGRRPFTAAISKDEGATWQHVENLGTDPQGWYCYTAIEFVDDHVLLAHCEYPGLNSLQVTRLPVSWLYEANNQEAHQEAIDIGSRRELLVDHYLIEQLDGVRLELHRPIRREVVFRTDAAWEGNGSAYQSVFRDGDRFRMYYRGGHHPASKAYEQEPHSWETLCLAESRDGIHWTRPELNIVEFQGSKQNNLILDAAMVKEIGGSPAHTAVFKDSNPDCPEGQRYKMVIVGSQPRGLYLLVSADGIHFQLQSRKPFTTTGAFDSQNLMFWDSVSKIYREYHRQFNNGVRGIATATSNDPWNFPEPRWLEYPGASEQALYTNQIQPYYRAPHLLMGFPMRYNDRGWNDRGWSRSMTALPGLEERQYRGKQHPRYGTAVTDAAFMTSRDGVTFSRWSEAFIRPGPATKETWVYGDNFIFWGMLQTQSHLESAPDEISLYATEGYWEGDFTSVRRYTLRQDGFVSASAGGKVGTLLTRPLIFSGSELELNLATSAAGSVRVEIQDVDGKPLDGFSLAECPEIFGDTIASKVAWNDTTNVASLAGKPIRLRFELQDADLYSFRFTLADE